MADEANERIRIAAPQFCFERAIDFEAYPSWAKDVKSAAILERDDEGRGTRVQFRAAALGRSIRYVLQYDYSQAPGAFSWELEEGEMLRRLDGTYRFEADGPSATRVHYDLVVELALPLPGMVKRRAAGLIIGAALRELKRHIEDVA